MHKMVQNLEERLQHLGRKEAQRRFLREVYEQLVPGRKTEQQRTGEYRDFVQGGSGNILELVLHLEQRLQEYDMGTRAKRLREHYSGLYIPKD